MFSPDILYGTLMVILVSVAMWSKRNMKRLREMKFANKDDEMERDVVMRA